jgi:hypothetical protein
MALVLADEDFPFGVTSLLRSLGHDVATVFECGLANKKTEDPVVLNLALQESRVLLTINRWDFIRLHRTGLHHAGIIACTHDSDLDRMTRQIHEALATPENLAGRLVRVTRGGWSMDEQ